MGAVAAVLCVRGAGHTVRTRGRRGGDRVAVLDVTVSYWPLELFPGAPRNTAVGSAGAGGPVHSGHPQCLLSMSVVPGPAPV